MSVALVSSASRHRCGTRSELRPRPRELGGPLAGAVKLRIGGDAWVDKVHDQHQPRRRAVIPDLVLEGLDEGGVIPPPLPIFCVF